ncbi:MAG: TetR/AcrR family transcriptional regulator [Actinobacteria bacterium]|nr:TetR/AcrR family transcriptional regulator [Actinomycetota bacterium]
MGGVEDNQLAGSRKPRTRSFAKSSVTRQRILLAAAELLKEKGYHETRLNDVAERAEIQGGSLYYYFKSMDGLVEEVLVQGMERTREHVVSALAELSEGSTPRQRLETAIDAQLAARGGASGIVPPKVGTFEQAPEAIQARLLPIRRSLGQLWEKLIRDAIAAREIRADFDPYALRLFIINALDRFPDWPERTRRPIEEMSVVTRELLLAAIAPPDVPRKRSA